MDSDDGTALARLGRRLRVQRQALGLTLKEAAQAAGLSAGFLSQAERGLVAPSLSSLRGLARTLDLPLPVLLAQPDGGAEVTRARDRQLYGPNPARPRYERISARFPGHVLNGVLIHEAPGHRSEPIRHEGEEIFFIVKGALTVELEGQVHVLGTGDSLHFSSSRLHSSWNHSETETVVLHVCTMDVFGDTAPLPPSSPEPRMTVPAPYAELHRACDAAIGVKLFTISALDYDAGLARRVYTSDEAVYPLTGTKPMTRDGWFSQVIGRGETFVANTTAEFAPYFFDHALINDLGCHSAVNVPVMDGGTVVGTINLLDVEGHFTPERLERLQALISARQAALVAALGGSFG